MTQHRQLLVSMWFKKWFCKGELARSTLRLMECNCKKKKNNTVPHLNSSFQLAWLSKPVVWIKLHQMSGSNVIPNQNHMQRHRELSLKKKCDKFKLSSAGRCKFSFQLHDECLASPEVSCCAYCIFCLTKWKKNVSWKFDKKKQWWKTNRRSLLGSVIAIYIRYLHGTLVFSWFQHFFAPELGQQELRNIEASTCITAPVLRQTCHMDNSALCPILFQISLPVDWKRSDY